MGRIQEFNGALAAVISSQDARVPSRQVVARAKNRRILEFMIGGTNNLLTAHRIGALEQPVGGAADGLIYSLLAAATAGFSGVCWRLTRARQSGHAKSQVERLLVPALSPVN
jgi:hypothetical protein